VSFGVLVDLELTWSDCFVALLDSLSEGRSFGADVYGDLEVERDDNQAHPNVEDMQETVDFLLRLNEAHVEQARHTRHDHEHLHTYDLEQEYPGHLLLLANNFLEVLSNAADFAEKEDKSDLYQHEQNEDESLEVVLDEVG
jgi:hypothetical protein